MKLAWLIVSGDIGEADDVTEHPEAIAEKVRRPVYFMFGNHDCSVGGVTPRVTTRDHAGATQRYPQEPDFAGISGRSPRNTCRG